MSLHSVPDANAERRRLGYNDVTLQRPTKKRNVVDSSPSPGPSQAELFEDSEDEVNDFINTQLGDTHEPQPDDPQLDWRTQTLAQPPIEDDDVLSDPDEIPEADSELWIPQLITLAEDASQSRPPTSLGISRFLKGIYNSYSIFVARPARTQWNHASKTV